MRPDSDLKLIIDHLEQEAKYLEKQRNEHIAEWDLIGADAFQKSLIHTNKKLRILKNLENPNYNRISDCQFSIQNIERIIKEPIDDFDSLGLLDEQKKKYMLDHVRESNMRRKETLEEEIKELSSRPVKERPDDDQVLELLDDLKLGVINQLEFEIYPEHISLILDYRFDELILTIKFHSSNSKKSYFFYQNKIELKKIGFDENTWQLAIKSFKETKNLRILEILSIIYFDVFLLEGKISRNVHIS